MAKFQRITMAALASLALASAADRPARATDIGYAFTGEDPTVVAYLIEKPDPFDDLFSVTFGSDPTVSLYQIHISDSLDTVGATPQAFDEQITGFVRINDDLGYYYTFTTSTMGKATLTDIQIDHPPIDHPTGGDKAIDRYHPPLPCGFTVGCWSLLAPDASAAPEPASWALYITGFVGLGAALRRRRAEAADLAAAFTSAGG